MSRSRPQRFPDVIRHLTFHFLPGIHRVTGRQAVRHNPGGDTTPITLREVSILAGMSDVVDDKSAVIAYVLPNPRSRWRQRPRALVLGLMGFSAQP
jgi:hypothetical protein